MTTKHVSLPIIACIAAFALAPTAPTRAACRPNTVAQTNNEIKLLIPFAVPVGLPVAPFAPYFYSYQAMQPRGIWSADLADEHRPNTNTPGDNDLPTIPAPRAALIATRCATCHGRQSPKAGLSFEQIDNLSPDIRLKVIRAVVSGRMPIGEKLSSDEVRSLVQEFTDLNHGDTEAQR